MARNGNGQYTLPPGNPVVPGTTITTEWANNTLSDIATALTGSVASDGQTPMSGNLDMSNNKIVNLTDGVNPQDAATVKQISNPAITGGTINGAVIGNTNPKDGNFLNLTSNTGDFSDGLTAPTVTPASDSSTKVATTAFVQSAIAAVSSGVTSFNGRSGVVTLQSSDISNALGYTPYNAGTNTVVTSANVLDYTVGKTGQGASGTWGISISGNAASANKANTVDTITSNQVSTALGYVPLTPNSPALLGTPTAPTAPVGTNTTQVATCAFVLANQGGGGAVQSVNGKTGAVVLNAADVGAYASNNPSGYTTLSAVQAQGYTTQAWVQSQGYVTSSTLANYVTTNTTQTIASQKTFTAAVNINAKLTMNNINFTIINAGGESGITVDNNTTSAVQLGRTGFGVARYTGNINIVTIAGGGFSVRETDNSISTGGQAFKPGGGAWADSSDIRLKSDVQTLTSCLDTINALNPVQFQWKMANSVAPNIGFIANEVEQVMPSAVTEITLDESINPYTGKPTDQHQYDQAQVIRKEQSIPANEPVKVKAIGWKNDMFAYLVGAIKDLNDQLTAVQTELQALKNK